MTPTVAGLCFRCSSSCCNPTNSLSYLLASLVYNTFINGRSQSSMGDQWPSYFVVPMYSVLNRGSLPIIALRSIPCECEYFPLLSACRRRRRACPHYCLDAARADNPIPSLSSCVFTIEQISCSQFTSVGHLVSTLTTLVLGISRLCHSRYVCTLLYWSVQWL